MTKEKGGIPKPPMRRHNNPNAALLHLMKPQGTTMSGGLISAHNADGTIDVTVDGVTLPDLPVAGDGVIVVGSPIWLLRTGTTLIAVPRSVATPWTNLTFQNSWAHYGSSFPNGQYRRLANGIVELRGLVRNGTGTGTVIANLPVGFRPDATHIYVCMVNGGGFWRVEVQLDGDIFVSVSEGTGSPTGWTSLSGISFSAVS